MERAHSIAPCSQSASHREGGGGGCPKGRRPYEPWGTSCTRSTIMRPTVLTITAVNTPAPIIDHWFLVKWHDLPPYTTPLSY